MATAVEVRLVPAARPGPDGAAPPAATAPPPGTPPSTDGSRPGPPAGEAPPREAGAPAATDAVVGPRDATSPPGAPPAPGPSWATRRRRSGRAPAEPVTAACAPVVERLGTARLAAYTHAVPEAAALAGPVPVPPLPPGTLPGAAASLDVRQACCMVALAAVEVLAGTRPLAQLARWVTPEVYDALGRRAALTAPRSRVLDPAAAPGDLDGGTSRGPVRRPSVRRVRACALGDQVVEASVVVGHADRVRAVAVRLTRASGRWRASALVVG